MTRAISAAWREVKLLILILGALTLLAFWSGILAAAVPLILLAWVIFFFRDPERQPESVSPEAILAPADGRVMAIEAVDEPLLFQGMACRISIFLSLYDIHIQRAPYSGIVKIIKYQRGTFTPAYLKESHRNEANFIGFETPNGPLVVKQIAGILARRIVCWSHEGDVLPTGKRLGLIRFGSRVDLYLPDNVEVTVQPAQQVYGGQTVIARWNKKGAHL